MRIIFAGTPEFSVGCLDALVAAGHEVVACYTQPDRKAGRGRKLSASAVKARAVELNIPVEQPQNFRGEKDRATLAAYQAELIVVVAYGLLLPESVLQMPSRGCINVHASILPRWRGAAPIQRAVAAGDAESGVTIMQMDVGLDTGDMLLIERTPIAANETGGSLHDRLAAIGAKALSDAIEQLQNGDLTPTPQDNSLANYAHKLDKAEAVIDWSLSNQQIEQTIRGFNPWPVAETQLGNKRVRVWLAVAETAERPGSPVGSVISADKGGLLVACGQGELRITKLQHVGGKPMLAADFLNGFAGGASALVGEQLG
ncbi:MAG: methionyl-tRNA formyltransferase [Pseudoalteromonas tetraodonis]|jgi:methionyl-tRNA formyltransferase